VLRNVNEVGKKMATRGKDEKSRPERQARFKTLPNGLNRPLRFGLAVGKPDPGMRVQGRESGKGRRRPHIAYFPLKG